MQVVQIVLSVDPAQQSASVQQELAVDSDLIQTNPNLEKHIYYFVLIYLLTAQNILLHLMQPTMLFRAHFICRISIACQV